MATHLFQYLTRREWKTLFCLVFLHESGDFRDAYPLDKYMMPEERRDCDDWETLFQRGIRFLSGAYGYLFEGVQVRADGEILFAPEPIEPANEMYYDLIAAGGLPHVTLALSEAIDDLTEKCPQFDVEPLRAARAAVVASLQAAPVRSEKTQIAIEETRRDALAALGLMRQPMGEEVN